MRHSICIIAFQFLLLQSVGCAPVVEYIAEARQGGEPHKGITYYVGGAGPIGHVGSWDVPRGLADAGYQGSVEIFTWQSLTHAGDQINLKRNREKAVELTARIKRYRQQYRDQPINIIALSAGTGITTFALEFLPEGAEINNVIFLGCSLSSKYDMTRALKRINGGLYVLHSPYDRILRNLVWYTGTVDRSSAAGGVAGLAGFCLPPRIGPDTEMQYKKLHNVVYRRAFSEAGYGGGHTDATRQAFVREYLADVLVGSGRRLLGTRETSRGRDRAESEVETTREATTREAIRSRPTSRPSEQTSHSSAPGIP